MCGISGVVVRSGDLVHASIERQLALLQHRGPDAKGRFDAPGTVVAQTRLSIVDLSSGDPVIQNEDRSVGVLLNGEIYNFRQLREELHRHGHLFRSTGDTEVLAHLIEEEPDPVSLARRLDGMFAFALIDAGNRRVVLGRDRLGKKPLYYWYRDGRLVFASEIKAVLADPKVARELDREVIPAYLALGYVPETRTFFAGVKSLPPGHVLTLTAGEEPRIEAFWKPRIPGASDLPRREVSFGDAAALVRAELDRAVSKRLVADVRVGAFLSGGLDSSAVVALMAQNTSRAVATFTVGFDEGEGFDERSYARLVANRIGAEHHEFVVRPDAIELVDRLLWHHDQPFGDSSAIPTFLLSELTKGHVKVALAGDGGDELFAGYERFTGALIADRLSRMPAPMMHAILGALRAAPRSFLGDPARAERFFDAAEVGLPGALQSLVSFVKERDRRQLVGASAECGANLFDDIWRGSEGGSTLDRLLDLNLRSYLVDDLLVKTDRMSMAHGLEIRCPLLDIQLLELAMSLPSRFKAYGPARKRVLRHAVSDLLPSKILARPKKGFGVPLDRWFREDLREYVRSTLGAKDARVGAHLRHDHVRRMLFEHEDGVREHGQALWTLLTLELFLRREGW
ncbi:MAG: asparagine synthase (glutamine-hydrolyzing) [Actinobacteria bacterium]|nr:MAG: asparagine synthase (glutamine-hydrolyzing) [Actinomycetota bacterium]